MLDLDPLVTLVLGGMLQLEELGAALNVVSVSMRERHYIEVVAPSRIKLKSFSEELIARYKNDLRFFTELRQTARRDAMETVDYSIYEEQIRKLVDKQVIGTEVREPEGVYLVHQLGQPEEPKDWSDEKTRNETDMIRTRVRKTIEQELADDPYAQKVFGELLRQAIAEAEAMFDHPLKQYALFKSFEEKLDSRATPGVPDALADKPHAKAYFGAIRLVLGDDAFAALSEESVESYVSGESLHYLGRRYRLKVIVTPEALAEVRMRGAFITAVVPTHDPAMIRSALDAWYRQRAREVFAQRLPVIAEPLRWVRELPFVRLQFMKRQWGSCSPSGRITLNPCLVKAPREAIDYVLLHEMCHLEHHNHSPAFYSMLDRHMPDWRKIKERLDERAEAYLRR
ncbi:M48 family metallopeptidase [Niveibacterium microcysteis]|uniref:M48 family metallopeptidase n=1 Tax=Niveibacterium microcysteis TaxID=2811415 RepID=A0ABX7M4H8_9RHOO|nr:SprT family zinc-dependent metalloprotease [Niveibacterium microcysteis]QSI75355.1 M48 family metallopeptidase [Niveibacterium microcysteis]